jgi:glycosyltransferase involved in cell wall biosynthesis
MRILHVVHQYAPDYVGGTELYTQTIAQAQRGLGHEVAVFCPSPAPASAAMRYELTIEEGVAVYRVPVGGRSRLVVFRDTFWQRRLGKGFTAVLAHHRPDLIHIQHLMGLPFGIIRQLPPSQPYIITLHDYWYLCANGQLITNDSNQTCAGPVPNYHNCGRCALARGGQNRLSPLAPLLAPLLRYRNQGLHHVLAQARQVIAPTEFVQKVYAEQGLPTGNLRVLRHGITVPHDEIAAIRAATPYAPQSPLRVGYVGSIAWQKGVHLLLEAVAGLPPGLVEVHVFGSLTDFPEYVAQLQARGDAERVFFHGRVPRPQLWQTLANLDLLVLPTLWYEASPLIIDEAFAIGLPIVAAAIGAMSEKIRDGIDGRLFPPGDAPALQTLLHQLATDPTPLTAYHHAIPPVRTTAQHLQELEAVYQSLVPSDN